MANLKYDQVPTLLAGGDLNWAFDHIQAYLVKGAAYVATQKRLSEMMIDTTTVKVKVTDVQGRSVNEVGEALGLPVTFPKVEQDTSYQVILAKDDGSGDDVLVAFYDQDENGDPLRLLNSGTLIVRPVLVPAADPPTTGVWLVFGT